jgi:hypothetical protein
MDSETGASIFSRILLHAHRILPSLPVLVLLVATGCGSGGSGSADASADGTGTGTTTTGSGGPGGDSTGSSTGTASATGSGTTGGTQELPTTTQQGSSGDASTTTEDTTGATTSGTSSTGDPAVCGDGVREAPEMCEPDEPDCQADCTYPQGFVFWTDIVEGITLPAGARAWGAAFDSQDAPLAAIFRGGSWGEGAGGYIKKYTRTGDEVWNERWTEGDQAFVVGYALTVQPDDSPVLVGQVNSGGPTDNDGFIGQMTADGALGWGRQFELANNDWLRAAHALPDGSIVAVGTRNQDPMVDDRGWIVKVNSAGIEAWQHETEVPTVYAGLMAVAQLGDGRIIVFGCCLDGGKFMLRAFESDGSIAWTAPLPVLRSLSFDLSGMTVDRHGDIVVAWRTVDEEFWLGKFAGDGAELWTKNPIDPMLGDIWPKGIVATPQGRYFIVGFRQVIGADIFYASLDEDGVLLWSDVVDTGGESLDQVRNVAVDSRGVVLMTGEIQDEDLKAWVRMIAP